MPTLRRPNTTLVLKQLKELQPHILQIGARAMRRGLEAVKTIAQREYLSGPRPSRLDVRTARLRNSISSEVKIVEGKGVVGRVGTNVRYAAYHEFGYRGGINVSAHTRVISQTNKKGEATDSRRQFRDRDGDFIGFRDSRKQAQTGVAANNVQFVKAHTRQMKYAGRPFLAPALKRGEPIILDELKKEMAKIQPPPLPPSK